MIEKQNSLSFDSIYFFYLFSPFSMFSLLWQSKSIFFLLDSFSLITEIYHLPSSLFFICPVLSSIFSKLLAIFPKQITTIFLYFISYRFIIFLAFFCSFIIISRSGFLFFFILTKSEIKSSTEVNRMSLIWFTDSWTVQIRVWSSFPPLFRMPSSIWVLICLSLTCTVRVILKIGSNAMLLLDVQFDRYLARR